MSWDDLRVQHGCRAVLFAPKASNEEAMIFLKRSESWLSLMTITLEAFRVQSPECFLGQHSGDHFLPYCLEKGERLSPALHSGKPLPPLLQRLEKRRKHLFFLVYGARGWNAFHSSPDSGGEAGKKISLSKFNCTRHWWPLCKTENGKRAKPMIRWERGKKTPTFQVLLKKARHWFKSYAEWNKKLYERNKVESGVSSLN